MVTYETVSEIRDVVQKMIIPIVFVVGLIGNSITVIVLTRKSMRCSTNVYLTALAVTDMLYLTTTFLLTLQHYQSIHLYHPLYWRCFGLIIWFHDGLSYISIYIATCFTIERFIAVRYPIRRQQFCTEELAKKVIVGISIFCITLTVSTAFEYSVDVKENYFNVKTNQPCPAVLSNLKNNATLLNDTTTMRQPDIFNEDDDIIGRALPTAMDIEKMREGTQRIEAHTTEPQIFDNETCVEYHRHTYSELGLNADYYAIFFHFTTLVFVIIPLTILITFNTFLIVLVRKSRTLRTEMTKMSIRKPSSKSLTAAKTSKVSQENKITIVLIAVVILFIVCQLPWSIYIIVDNYMDDIDQNLKLFLGNIFNLLVDINSATNFFLYCVLSDKYRKTVKELIMNLRYGHHHQRHQNSKIAVIVIKWLQDITQMELTREGTLTTSWNRHHSRYTFNHRANSMRRDLIRKPKEISYPMHLLSKQLNRLEAANQLHHHEYQPLCEDLNATLARKTKTLPPASATQEHTSIMPRNCSSGNLTTQLLSAHHNMPLHPNVQQMKHAYQVKQQQHQQQHPNEFAYAWGHKHALNDIKLQLNASKNTTNNVTATTSSQHNLHNNCSANRIKGNWNPDLMVLDNQYHQQQQHGSQHRLQQQCNVPNLSSHHLLTNPALNQTGLQSLQHSHHNFFDQHQHSNRYCPYYLSPKNSSNKALSRPTVKALHLPDLDYGSRESPDHQTKQQRRRSLSLTALPKIKHAPHCKDFPDDL